MSGSRAQSPKPARPRWVRSPLKAGNRADFPIVAIGASAGGLEACKKLLDALPADNGMAFLIVQHLDPSHDSLLVDLLSAHTSMQVVQATDGMAIERDHVHIIPPGLYLSADGKGILRLSRPPERHGARLPFDFLLNSLASVFGARVVCVVLSGTGADGSEGLKAVKAKHGLVIAQEIGEADYDGMPRSAIATGAWTTYSRRRGSRPRWSSANEAKLLRQRIGSRPRTSRYRIYCRRSSICCGRRRPTISRSTSTEHSSAVSSAGWRWRRPRPPKLISNSSVRDPVELDQLSTDMLINVTGFFRDPPVFDFLATRRHSRPRARSSFGSAVANLDRWLQFRRGDLLPRHVAARADR